MPWLFRTEHAQQRLAVNKVYIVCLLVKRWNLRSIHKNPSKTFMRVRRKKCFNIAWSSPPNSSFEAASWHHLWDPPMQNNESVEQGQNEESRLVKLKKEPITAISVSPLVHIHDAYWSLLHHQKHPSHPSDSYPSFFSLLFARVFIGLGGPSAVDVAQWTYFKLDLWECLQTGFISFVESLCKNNKRMLKITHESTRNASSKGHAGHAAHPPWRSPHPCSVAPFLQRASPPLQQGIGVRLDACHHLQGNMRSTFKGPTNLQS